ncbi:hypothetical protein [Oceanobacillus halophilus]|uniref:Uncharacterized protein n=1 Tax=Oceanobacillus halophilus TaxID=930130 RepID=A0A495A1H0_9BACI|nr:hypothetical protein [Oceanobacillus halophilus]RKQ32618.1 hypothetical protein D8M06_11810 [Oceanobacillus halophilus]
MSILIINCNHWIGFHIVNKMLDTDYIVEGIIDKNTSDDLAMFFARNSSFSFVEEGNKKEYEVCIMIGDYKNAEKIRAKRKFVINPNNGVDRGDVIKIQAPMLFGEWMPMNKDGIFYKDKFVAFESKEFNNEAVYINIFMSALLQWIRSENIPKCIVVNPNHDRKEKILENSVYIRENRPISKYVRVVQKHYELYKRFY